MTLPQDDFSQLAFLDVEEPGIVRYTGSMPTNSAGINGPSASKFNFAQRLYAGTYARMINLLLDEGLDGANIAADFNRRGFVAINGAAWDALAVAQVLELENAIRKLANIK